MGSMVRKWAYKISDHLLTRIDYRCADGRLLLSAHGVTIFEWPFFFSSETEVIKGIKVEKHPYFHKLNGRKLLAAFQSATSEGLMECYSQSQDLPISNGSLNTISFLHFLN